MSDRINSMLFIHIFSSNKWKRLYPLKPLHPSCPILLIQDENARRIVTSASDSCLKK